MLKKIVTIIATIILLNISGVFATDITQYPLTEDYPNGIEEASSALWSDSQKVYPLNTDYEKTFEIEKIEDNNFDEQLFISDNNYSGKFSLGLNIINNEMIFPLRETELYSLGEMVNRVSSFRLNRQTSNTASYSLRDTDFTIETTDKNVIINGATTADTDIALLVENSAGEISYIFQTLSDKDGKYKFAFPLNEYGDYTVKLRGKTWENIVQTELSLLKTSSGTIIPPSESAIEDYVIKTNIVNIWVKPGFLAEEISFYIKSENDEYIKILSDKNNDGTFKLGEDFSQGKWQQLTLDLLKYDSEEVLGKAKGLYISANSNSNWLFDCITSDFNIINDNFADISSFEKDNFKYSDDELKFDTYEKNTYNVSPVITSSQININEKINKIDIDYGYKKNDVDLTSLKTIKLNLPGLTRNSIFSQNGNLIYYINTSDNNYTYSYNLKTNELRKIAGGTTTYPSYVSENGMYFVSGYNLYSYETDSFETLSSYYNIVDNNGMVYSLNVGYNVSSWFLYLTMPQLNKTWNVLDIGYDHKYYTYSVSGSGKYILCFNQDDKYALVLKHENNEWYHYENIAGVNAYFNNEETLLYSNSTVNYDNLLYEKNLTTRTVRTIEPRLNVDYTIFGITSDGELMLKNRYVPNGGSNRLFLYNPTTGKQTYTSIEDGNSFVYNSDLGMIVYKNANNEILCYSMEAEKTTLKALLSFDGNSTWMTYKGNRWIRNENELTNEYIENYGMTVDEINKLTSADFEKLYENNTEIHSVGICFYVASYTDDMTPVVKDINIKTYANETDKYLYCAKSQIYSKDDYSKINGIFPVENFENEAECYYFLYLGNDWLYTYKNGEFIHIENDCTNLFENIKDNWIKIKQYGLTKSELRSIPTKMLTSLFLNENIANNNFGIIYAIKVDDLSTVSYNVEFKNNFENKFISTDEVTLEINLSDNRTLTFTSDELSEKEIEEFLSWLNNSGENKSFYNLKTNDKSYFINYFMITNVNINSN